MFRSEQAPQPQIEVKNRTEQATAEVLFDAYRVGLFQGERLHKMLDHALRSLTIAYGQAVHKAIEAPDSVTKLATLHKRGSSTPEQIKYLAADLEKVRAFAERGYRVIDEQLKQAQTAAEFSEIMARYLKDFILDTPRPEKIETQETPYAETIAEAYDIFVAFMMDEVANTLRDALTYYDIENGKKISMDYMEFACNNRRRAQQLNPRSLPLQVPAAAPPADTEDATSRS